MKFKGFYHMEPFVPIEVPSYSNEEILNYFEYYKEKNWLQSPEAKSDEGKEELFFLSAKNPSQFQRVCQIA